MNVAEKKILIEKALSPYLSGEQLLEALIIWELRYSRQTTAAFQGFLSDICTTPALSSQRTRILQSLIRTLTSEDGKLLTTFKAPESIATATSPSQIDLASNHADACILRDKLTAREKDALHGGMQLINTLFARTPGDINSHMRENLSKKLPDLNLSSQASTAVKAWLSGEGNTPDGVLITESSLRDMVRILHASLCECVSLTRADQLIKDALQQTESYYQGSFSLRKLLPA